jgi:hypothetical protein
VARWHQTTHSTILILSTSSISSRFCLDIGIMATLLREVSQGLFLEAQLSGTKILVGNVSCYCIYRATPKCFNTRCLYFPNTCCLLDKQYTFIISLRFVCSLWSGLSACAWFNYPLTTTNCFFL